MCAELFQNGRLYYAKQWCARHWFDQTGHLLLSHAAYIDVGVISYVSRKYQAYDHLDCATLFYLQHVSREAVVGRHRFYYPQESLRPISKSALYISNFTAIGINGASMYRDFYSSVCIIFLQDL